MSDIDASVEIKIAPNGMKATANYIPPQGEGKALTVEDVLSKLDSLGVTSGIKHDHIDTICVSDKPMINIIIAEATQPQVGKKARIIQYFEINKLNKAQEREDGGVDFRDLGEISSALKDQELYRRIPPTIGDPGKDVFGEEITGISGRDLKLVVYHGTKVDENDPNLIRAAHDGEIIIKNGVVQVLKLHKINGDIDFSTGNVKFKGSVTIKGCVKAGFNVEADGDISIDGKVEDAKVIGGNDITIMGGYTGNGNGVVHADRDVYVKFIENQEIQAGRDIIISGYSYHSTLRAGRSIVAKGNKSLIVGGQSEARLSIESMILGSDAAVKTVIKVGTDPKLAERIKKVKEEIEETKESAEKLEKSIVFLYGLKIDNKGKLPPDKEALLEKLKETKKVIPGKLKMLEVTLEKIQKEHEEIDKAFAKANIAVYPKVQVFIGKQQIFCEDKLGPSTIKMLEGKVVRFSY